MAFISNFRGPMRTKRRMALLLTTRHLEHGNRTQEIVLIHEEKYCAIKVPQMVNSASGPQVWVRVARKNLKGLPCNVLKSEGSKKGCI